MEYNALCFMAEIITEQIPIILSSKLQCRSPLCFNYRSSQEVLSVGRLNCNPVRKCIRNQPKPD